MLLKGYADNWKNDAYAKTRTSSLSFTAFVEVSLATQQANVMPDGKPESSVMPFANRFEGIVQGLVGVSLPRTILSMDHVRLFRMLFPCSLLFCMNTKTTFRKVTLWFDREYYSRRDSVRFYEYKKMCIVDRRRLSWKLYYRRLSCYHECCFQRIRRDESLKGLWEWVCG